MIISETRTQGKDILPNYFLCVPFYTICRCHFHSIKLSLKISDKQLIKYFLISPNIRIMPNKWLKKFMKSVTKQLVP